jgi:hypothetical protein
MSKIQRESTCLGNVSPINFANDKRVSSILFDLDWNSSSFEGDLFRLTDNNYCSLKWGKSYGEHFQTSYKKLNAGNPLIVVGLCTKGHMLVDSAWVYVKSHD